MPRAVMTSYNPHLRMSNGTMASVQFKIDQEKAKYEKTIKILNMSEKVEMRIVQKQVEEVKKELTLMKAYQHVAKQMAFKNFDPVIRRRRERRERERREEEEAAVLQRQQQHGNRSNDEDDGDDGDDDGDPNRRLSMNGNVVVTLQDIMGNDDVLKRNSRELYEKRRKSQASLECLDYGEDSFGNGNRRRRSDASSYVGKLRSPRRGSLVSVGSSGHESGKEMDDSVDYERENGGQNAIGDSKGSFLDAGSGSNQRRRRSRAGSFGILSGLDSIEEKGLEIVKESGKVIDEGCEGEMPVVGSSVGSKTNSLVVSGRKGFKTTGNLVKGFFITSSTEDCEEKESKFDKKDGINDKREQPMSIYQISKFYDQQKSRRMEECKHKELNYQKRLERRKYESLRRRLQKEKFEKENRSSKKSMETNKAASASDARTTVLPEKGSKDSEKTSPQIDQTDSVTCDIRIKTAPVIIEPPLEVEATEASTSAPKLSSPLKGLARFKNAATAVSVQLKIADASNSKKNNRLKNIAAAVMMTGSTTASGGGRVPRAFMYTDDFAERLGRERDKTKATALEASHRKPEDCKVRPLPMPESVKAEYAEKWKGLMGSINGAVHWKVRALRADTGTLNSRQIRRQAREEQPGVVSVSPRTPRNPPRSVFPGACKTTWAVKKFVSQEINDVLKAWDPDNVRRKRNQKMKAKVSLPDFIDRVRTTTSILRSFRSFCKDKGSEDDGGDNGGGDNGGGGVGGGVGDDGGDNGGGDNGGGGVGGGDNGDGGVGDGGDGGDNGGGGVGGGEAGGDGGNGNEGDMVDSNNGIAIDNDGGDGGLKLDDDDDDDGGGGGDRKS